ncbi:peptidylprolyl isomerase [Candidatus Bathycorpusculum sp.]|jgi:cyclophilin family peptidyl-prolyl cis-trans isomerase|uniref:peptidylprolyl isomerase n=1 Tax=Candidatus Bathycorpusculum sp. TaxID=2994959 RepID=UPI00281AFDF5|nr:peptidylprolyl isomerase [Candidatus Termitimicrobium sp.]MCL2686396.1 peptidylprolyl isomerase [Candidatus Termitimicrobium sp.]
MAPKKQKPKKRLTPAQQKQNSKRMTWIAIGAIIAVVVIFGVIAASGILGNNSPEVPPDPIDPTKVLLETTAGNITIDLRIDKPITSTNFIELVRAGEYDNTSFYRTIEDFMIQGGKGASGGGIPNIKDEIGTNNRNDKYTIAMANTGVANSGSSEFFINVADNGQLISGFNSAYTVFGTIIDGKDVVDAIASAPVTENPARPDEMSVPVNPVIILRATILP